MGVLLISALRGVLQEAPGGEHWIETLPRWGYRYVGPPVETGDAALQARPSTVAASRPLIVVVQLSIKPCENPVPREPGAA